MEDLILVTEGSAFEKLVHEASDCIGIKRASVPMLIHILFEVLFAVLEYEDQLCFGMDNVVETDDVDVLELLHKGDLADRSGWCPFFSIEMDLFQCNDFVGGSRSSLGRVQWLCSEEG